MVVEEHRRIIGNLCAVPGSPTPRELAMADGSVRKYRIGPWSSWGIRTQIVSRLDTFLASSFAE